MAGIPPPLPVPGRAYAGRTICGRMQRPVEQRRVQRVRQVISKVTAETLCRDLKTFKTYRDSHTEEGKDFSNPEVKAWLKRQRRRKF